MSANRKTVLIVEDEPLIPLGTEDLIRDLRFSPIVSRTIENALMTLGAGQTDMAIPDYKIRGDDAEAVALELRRRSIPFLVCSGTTIDRLTTVLKDAPFLTKPFADVEPQKMVLAALAG